jgi:hypothetical protein
VNPPPRLRIELLLTLSPQELETQFGDLALLMGPSLAEQVMRAVEEERLGYIPALDYFAHSSALERQLYDSARHIYSMVTYVVTRTVRADLREILGAIEIESAHPVAETLPRVRPGDAAAWQQLARHYSPQTIRLGVTGRLRATGHDSEPAPKLAVREAIGDQLRRHFAAVEIIAIQSA